MKFICNRWGLNVDELDVNVVNLCLVVSELDLSGQTGICMAKLGRWLSNGVYM